MAKAQRAEKVPSYSAYRQTRNQPVKDHDQIFRTELREGEMEVLGVDESGGYAGDIGGGGDSERVSMKEVEPTR